MAEKSTIYSVKTKHKGNFPFKDFYKFLYDWLIDEKGLEVMETSYVEAVQGDSKNVEFKWECEKKITDYFKFVWKLEFRILGMKDVEITNATGQKVKTQNGSLEWKTKGILVRDYQGKFEISAWRKTLMSLYEKYIIADSIDQMETQLFGDCEDFIAQAKAYLDLAGKR
jgi:hypothetical protein